MTFSIEGLAQEPPALGARPTAAFVPDRVLVQFKAEVKPETAEIIHSYFGTQLIRRLAPLEEPVDVVRLWPGDTVNETIKRYEATGLVVRAEPDYLLYARASPNDPRYLDGTLWALRNTGRSGGVVGADIDAGLAWDTRNSASNIVVAVIDSGVRYTHEDLAANMWINPGESGRDALGRDKRTNGADDDNNGLVDDVHGIDAVQNTGDPFDPDGHGTHVAGTIGAAGNNGLGVVGVAWRVQIMACRFLDSTGFGSTSDAVQSVDYARNKGARIINASWGNPAFSSTLESAIRRARDAGIIVVVAAGNESNNNDTDPSYPASYNLDNIVGVAATTRTDTLASFSDFGATTIDLAAPGASIYSTFSTADSSYAYLSGTSMAAPHVAGALALVRAAYPNDAYRTIINRVLATTEPLPSLAGKCLTGGRLDVRKALTASLIADFAASTLAGSPPLTVQFSNSSFGDGITSEWNFGDGTSGSAKLNPMHVFSEEGNFTVTLTVTDRTGARSAKSRPISVVANYQMQTAAFNWIDPSAMPALTLADNGVSSSQALPFALSFYGQNYDRLYVAANGLVGFVRDRLETASNTDFPNPGLPNATICPWWDDLNPAGGGRVRIGTMGTAPNRRVVVSWVNVPHRDRTDYSFTFQVVLHETSHEILFQYLEVQAARSRGAGRLATIGLENETGLVARKYSLNGSTLLRNNLAVLFVPTSAGRILISPASGLAASGPIGGPFSPDQQVYSIENTAKSAVNWAVLKRQDWVAVSATNGLLAAGQKTNLTVSIDADARDLRPGSYLDTLSFLNLNNGNGNTTRPISVEVNGNSGVLELTPQTGFNSSGFVGGPFNPANQLYTLVNAGDARMEWSAEKKESWLAVTPPGSVLAAGESTTITVTINGGAQELPDGTYADTIAFKNLTNGQGDTSRRAVLTVVSPSAALSILPEAGLHFTSVSGAPLETMRQELTLTNPSVDSLEWSAATSQPWASLSTDHGRLAAGESVTFALNINTNALSLPTGTHTAVVTFKSTGGGASARLEVTLTLTGSVRLMVTKGGVMGEPLRICLAGEPGQSYLISASPNLRDWVPLSTNTVPPSSIVEITDPDAANAGLRFYRAVRAP